MLGSTHTDLRERARSSPVAVELIQDWYCVPGFDLDLPARAMALVPRRQRRRKIRQATHEPAHSRFPYPEDSSQVPEARCLVLIEGIAAVSPEMTEERAAWGTSRSPANSATATTPSTRSFASTPSASSIASASSYGPPARQSAQTRSPYSPPAGAAAFTSSKTRWLRRTPQRPNAREPECPRSTRP
jgi:hypothetical protein